MYEDRDGFLKVSKVAGVITRSIWWLMNRLEMFKFSQTGDLAYAYWLEQRVVNVPSGDSRE